MLRSDCFHGFSGICADTNECVYSCHLAYRRWHEWGCLSIRILVPFLAMYAASSFPCKYLRMSRNPLRNYISVIYFLAIKCSPIHVNLWIPVLQYFQNAQRAHTDLLLWGWFQLFRRNLFNSTSAACVFLLLNWQIHPFGSHKCLGILLMVSDARSLIISGADDFFDTTVWSQCVTLYIQSRVSFLVVIITVVW